MKTKIFLIIFSLIATTFLSQENQKVENNYANYFKLTREVPFLHLNKTSFINGEEIWFKAYILELNKKKLHPSTTNLYVSIYKENGDLKERKLVLIKDGIGKGNIKIDSSYKSNAYYIKAHTKWMDNFVEKQEYLQKIKIIGNATNKVIEKEISFDIQLLPEGGNLITNAINSIGILVKDNTNEGLKIIKGEIFNNNDKKIIEFSNNELGLGKFSFFYKQEQEYKAIFALDNGEKIEKKIEDVKRFGIALEVSNPNTSYMNIKLKTNSKTLSRFVGKKFHIYIHNTSSYLKRTITFKKGKQVYELLIRNKKLKKGINIITLFDNQNRPIAERLIFNYDKNLFSTVKITHKKISKDSISINLNSDNDSTTTNLSASFLPYKTKSYNPKNNVYSAFLLKPYIKGDIQNPNYYFKNINRKKLADLDLLLLTQGWSKYKWTEVFNNPPKILNPGEKGVSIYGTINMKDENASGKISLFSFENNLALSGTYSNNRFNFTNLYLKDSSSISLLYENAKGQQEKYKGYLRFSVLNSFDKLKNLPKEFKIKEDLKSLETPNFIMKAEVLDEVIIRSKLKITQKPERGVADRAIKIDSMFSPSVRFLEFITLNGFLIDRQDVGFSFILRRNKNIPNPPISQVFLDNIDITFNNRELEFLRLEDIDEVHITSSGPGIINVFSKNTFKREFNDTKKDYKVPFGFSHSKEYYQPRYADTENAFFTNYGALLWKPSIKLTPNSKENSFNIPILNQETIKVFIEGITKNGSLISVEKTLIIE